DTTACTSGSANCSGHVAATHPFHVTVDDLAGNHSADTTYTWTIDLSGPTISIDTKPSATTNSTSATFQFNATDDAAGVDSSTFQDRQSVAEGAACGTGPLSNVA